MPDGRPKEVSCRIVLQKLERRSLIKLPAARKASFVNVAASAVRAPVWSVLRSTLAQLGRVSMAPVDATQAAQSRLWWAMMRAHHPQGASPLCGAQVRYLIACESGGKMTFIGGLSFSAAAWRLSARDAWIGWDDSARKAGLSKVVGNSRFLILPDVEVPNLASQVLSLAAKRLPADWEERYGITPVLLETFVDRAHYRVACYRAANWMPISQTRGRGRQDRRHAACVGAKDVLVYPRHTQWRSMLAPDGAAVPTCTRAKIALPATPPTGPSKSLAAAPCPTPDCRRAC